MFPVSLLSRLSVAVSAATLAVALPAQNIIPAGSAETITLQPFSVTAEKSSSYRVTSSTTATRTNTALIDIPQTVDIVTKEFWRDISATSFDESFKYVANVYVRNRHAGSGDGVNLRGFETNGSIAVDGVRMGNYKRDLVGYERLEIVKGPPSAVQGRAGGTGLLNYILKKPSLADREGYVRYRNSWNEFDAMMHRAEFDINLPLRRDSLAMRVAGSWQDGEDYIKFNRFRNFTIYPSFRWQLSDDTELVLVNEFLNLNTPSRDEGHGFAIYPENARRLIPRFDNSADPITSLRLPHNFNLIGPDNVDKQRIATSTLSLTHRFAENIFVRQVVNLRYLFQDSFAYGAENNLVLNMPSQRVGNITSTNASTLQGDLVARFRITNWLNSNTLVGYSYNDSDTLDQRFSGKPDAPFNFLNIAAIAASGNSRSYYEGRGVSTLARTTFRQTSSHGVGVFVQQDFGLWQNRLLLSGGIRTDRDFSGTRNLVSGVQTSVSDTKLDSYRYGLTFKFNARLAAYVVSSLQNDPTSTRLRFNGLLAGDSRLGESFTVSPYSELQEAGLKGELFKGRMSFSLAYWEMIRAGSVVNILAPGVSMGQNVNIGTQTLVEGAQSEGWEFSAYGNVTDRLSLIANYTKMKTGQAFRGQQNAMGWNSTTNNPGRIPLRFAPEWNGNLFAKYSFRDSQGHGWEVRAGISAIGPFYAQVTGVGLTLVPESQRTFDAGLSYRWKRYTADLAINNIDSSPMMITRTQPPRTYNLTLTADF
jgi:outer membrane receptor for monomeric catechols